MHVGCHDAGSAARAAAPFLWAYCTVTRALLLAPRHRSRVFCVPFFSWIPRRGLCCPHEGAAVLVLGTSSCSSVRVPSLLIDQAALAAPWRRHCFFGVKHAPALPESRHHWWSGTDELRGCAARAAAPPFFHVHVSLAGSCLPERPLRSTCAEREYRARGCVPLCVPQPCEGCTESCTENPVGRGVRCLRGNPAWCVRPAPARHPRARWSRHGHRMLRAPHYSVRAIPRCYGVPSPRCPSRGPTELDRDPPSMGSGCPIERPS